MKKILYLLCIVAVILVVGGCYKKENKKEDNVNALQFKTDYESLNGLQNAKGVDYRILSINENNPFIYTTASEILTKLENNESFYVYFGDAKCPWCRSVVEKAIEVANTNKIDKIYYVSIWDKDHNEVLRSTYTVDSKGNTTMTKEGTTEYYKLLEAFDNVLNDYTLSYTNKKGKTVKVNVGEKRIYAPNFIKVVDGKSVEKISGNSSLQTESNGELTEEILKDEENIFNEFFKN